MAAYDRNDMLSKGIRTEPPHKTGYTLFKPKASIIDMVGKEEAYIYFKYGEDEKLEEYRETAKKHITTDDVPKRDYERGETISSYKASHQIYDIEFSNDNEMIAIAQGGEPEEEGSDKAIIISSSNGEEILSYDKHEKSVWSVNFDSTDRYLLTGSHDAEASLFGLENKNTFLRYKELNDRVYTDFDYVNSLIALASRQQGEIHIVNPFTGDLLSVLDEYPGWITDISFCPNTGSYIAVCGHTEVVHIYNVFTGDLVFQYEEHDESIYAVEWSNCGNYIATASSDCSSHIIDLNSGEKKTAFRTEKENWILSISLSSNTQFACIGTKNGKLYIYDTETADIVYEDDRFENRVYAVDFSYNDSAIAAADIEGNLYTIYTKLKGVSHFTDKITNLMPDTKYYYQAIMSDKDRNIINTGQILSVRTKEIQEEEIVVPYIEPQVEFRDVSLFIDDNDELDSKNEKLDNWDIGIIRAGESSKDLLMRIWNNRFGFDKDIDEFFILEEDGERVLELMAPPKDLNGDTINVKYKARENQMSTDLDEFDEFENWTYYEEFDLDDEEYTNVIVIDEGEELSRNDRFYVEYVYSDYTNADWWDPDDLQVADMNNVTLYPLEYEDIKDENKHHYNRSHFLVHDGWLKGRDITLGEEEMREVRKTPLKEGEDDDDIKTIRSKHDFLEVGGIEFYMEDGERQMSELLNARDGHMISGDNNDGSGIDWLDYVDEDNIHNVKTIRDENDNLVDIHYVDNVDEEVDVEKILESDDWEDYDVENFSDVQLRVEVPHNADFGPTDFFVAVRYYYV